MQPFSCGEPSGSAWGKQPAAQVLCFPHAGGSAAFFRPFKDHLPRGYGVAGVQYPGRQDRLREPFVTTVEELADQIALQLRPPADVPLVLFGHSMGAVVAFEVARRLEAGRPTGLLGLVVSGRRAPSTVRHEAVHRAGDRALIAEVTGLGGTEERLFEDEELMRLVVPVLRNDYRAIETYRANQDLLARTPVLCLRGDRDPKVDADEAAAWARHTAAGCAVEEFPGGHFFLNERRPEVGRSIERFTRPLTR
ncbi:hypothetical protein AVL59_15460 [Streptomyces griseochromogenes]|uniref:Thioesterase TesA-like domain-containing protein n=1 Tax=Streptomyces griseochromogenes TaxID=68214 RepID=A0A1B1BCK4_9ACTN|nr:hypothetical protein AVL59_15460 [Streptomyces griseochromogenes]